MKIRISEDKLNEFINADLSYIEGDQPYAQTEITVSKMGRKPKPNISDDYVEQATQDRSFPNSFSGWGMVRESEEQLQIGGLEILDAFNQKGLKQSTINIVQSLDGVAEEKNGECVAIVLKYVLSNVDMNNVRSEFKEELIRILRT